jgi:hypothetical protein
MMMDDYQDWLDQHADQIANEECDALLARMEARRLVEKSAPDSELVYKTTWTPEVSMDANEWLQENLAKFADIIGDEMGRSGKELRDEIVARIEALESRLAALETRGSIVPLRGNRDVA